MNFLCAKQFWFCCRDTIWWPVHNLGPQINAKRWLYNYITNAFFTNALFYVGACLWHFQCFTAVYCLFVLLPSKNSPCVCVRVCFVSPCSATHIYSFGVIETGRLSHKQTVIWCITPCQKILGSCPFTFKWIVPTPLSSVLFCHSTESWVQPPCLTACKFIVLFLSNMRAFDFFFCLINDIGNES